MTSHGSPLRIGERVRVLWLIKGLGQGGAEQLLALTAQVRDREHFAYEVAYLLPWKTALVPRLEADGVPTHCLRARGNLDLRWLWRLRRLVRSRPVDVVHVHSPVAAVGARLVLRTLRNRPALVATEHNVWSSHARATAFGNARTAALDDARFAVSEAVRSSMPEVLQRSTEVVRYGIDIDAVRADGTARAEMRASLGIGPDELVVGTVANLRATKAYPDLLEAARIVTGRFPHVVFVAAGQGPQERELHELHARLGLGDRFRFLGHRADATRLMAAFDVFCLASIHEGLPIAVMEALAIGLPIVTTDVGGIREIVTDGAEAMVVPTGRPDCLADALSAVVTDDRRRVAMAIAARAHGDDLGVGNAARRMEAVYIAQARR